jgi:hypothetical protein
MRPRRPVLFISSVSAHPLLLPSARSSTPLPFVSFQSLTNRKFCNPFPLTFMQNAQGVYPSPLTCPSLRASLPAQPRSKPPFVFNHFPTLPFSVYSNPFVCHSYENCRGVEHSSHSGTHFSYAGDSTRPETIFFRHSRITRHGTRFSVHRLFPRLRPLTDHGTTGRGFGHDSRARGSCPMK